MKFAPARPCRRRGLLEQAWAEQASENRSRKSFGLSPKHYNVTRPVLVWVPARLAATHKPRKGNAYDHMPSHGGGSNRGGPD